MFELRKCSLSCYRTSEWKYNSYLQFMDEINIHQLIPSGFMQKSLVDCETNRLMTIHRFLIYEMKPVSDRWGHFTCCKYYCMSSPGTNESAFFSVIRIRNNIYIQKKFRSGEMDSEMLNYVMLAICQKVYKGKIVFDM